MDSSPFNRSGLTRRSPPPTPQPLAQTPSREPIEKMETISTPELQNWMGSIEQSLNEVCSITTEGKLNSEQKLRVSNLCRKVGHNVAQLAVQYQSLKQKAVQTHYYLQALNEKQDLTEKLATEIKTVIKESCTKPISESTSFADMVKKGSNSFVRPVQHSAVAIYPSDNSKTSDETRNLVQKIVCPEEMKLKVRGVRKVRNGGVIISTETKDDLEKLKQTVQHANSGLTVDEPQKRKPRIIIIGVPSSMAESEVYSCIFEQNMVDKVPSMTRDTFLSSIKLSHKSGRRDSDHHNLILEVSAVIRKALITQDRVFINWTSCPVRDFTLVTRCYNCQQYGHAAKSCKNTAPVCGHCSEEGHSIKECTKKNDSPKCATCLRFKNQVTIKPEILIARLG
ncbi:uncharacterized protein LOC118267009 [Spodoptera frugiperda]|uniref:Uncharacterized protein LOC118267009 n=1 Tax=Spodoptera frugiperda TaxID=7108 RepID=A0A9R0D173_SPOFR|nr:uncharacterized protein LOC118267009 [Spodoptera frugiperda]